ncbi:MAG: aldolase [Chloroflexi bacterium]|nr:aldolase [Chloroflexota bacterium]
MRGSELRQALASGQRVYGICLEGYGQPRWPALFARLGLDFVFLDNEHTPLGRETCAWAAQAYAAHGIAPLLRIPEPSSTYAAMALDLGAHGVIVPYVESTDQVRRLVGAVKYRPLKGAALHAALGEGEFPSPETATYLQTLNEDSVLIIMIESPAGVANLPDLLTIEGVDGVLIGPHDFSVSHGMPEDFDHPTFEWALRRVIRLCQEKSVGVGVHHIAGSLERERRWIEWGCNFVVHKSDTAFIAEGLCHELLPLKHSLGDGGAPGNLPWPLGPSRGASPRQTW